MKTKTEPEEYVPPGYSLADNGCWDYMFQAGDLCRWSSKPEHKLKHYPPIIIVGYCGHYSDYAYSHISVYIAAHGLDELKKADTPGCLHGERSDMLVKIGEADEETWEAIVAFHQKQHDRTAYVLQKAKNAYERHRKKTAQAGCLLL